MIDLANQSGLITPPQLAYLPSQLEISSIPKHENAMRKLMVVLAIGFFATSAALGTTLAVVNAKAKHTTKQGHEEGHEVVCARRSLAGLL